MLKKALRSLSSLGKNTRTHKNSIAPFRSRLSLEPLEQRRMLSAFDLSLYELHSKDENLSGAGIDHDFSGVVYHEPSLSFFIIDNGANTNNGAIHEYKYEEEVVQGVTKLTIDHHQRVINFKNFDEPLNGNPREGDPEGITWMGGDKFAFVREQLGFIHEFWIDVDGDFDADSDVDGDLAGAPIDTTEEIDKDGGSITTITPNPDPSRNDNVSLEGIAYDSDRSVFYVVKEKDWQDTDGQNGKEIIYQVATDGTVTVVHVDGLISEFAGKDVSDVYYYDDMMFLVSDEGKDITRLILNTTPDPDEWEFLAGGNDRFEIDAAMDQPEGITFSSDGFDMFLVGEDREFFHYRNYTDFTPNAAPDLHEDSDTGSSNSNNITTDTMPEFTGTLTRTVGGNSVPVDEAWVFLYKDGVPTGDKDETDASGNYSITVGTALALDDYEFTIRVGEEDDTLDERPENLSIVSAPLDVFIVASDVNGDLTGNGFVDFEDLTTLPANWNKDVSMAKGNLVEPTTTLVDFGDLTVLLAEWTGPDPGGPSPPASMVAHESTVPISGDPTVYSSSASVTVNFTEKVLGVDASDMLLSGSGTSGASVGAPSALRVNDGVWTFIISGLSIGTVDVTVAPDVNDITYDDGGASVDTLEWTFIAMPGVTFSSGALVIEGTSGDDTIDLIAGISTKAWSFKRMPLNTAVYAMSA